MGTLASLGAVIATSTAIFTPLLSDTMESVLRISSMPPAEVGPVRLTTRTEAAEEATKEAAKEAAKEGAEEADEAAAFESVAISRTFLPCPAADPARVPSTSDMFASSLIEVSREMTLSSPPSGVWRPISEGACAVNWAR